MRRLCPVLALALVASIGAIAPAARAADQTKENGAQPAGAAQPSASGAKVTAPPEPEGMQKLFNGKDLTGWEGDTRLWSAKDGVIHGETTKENPAKGNTFLIWKGGTLGDFDLRLSFRIPQPKGESRKWNSGVQYRARRVTEKAPNEWVVGGYQAEIEDTPGKVGFLYDERGQRGYLCEVGSITVAEPGEKKSKVVGKLGEKEEIGKAYKPGDWNEYVIVARGNKLKHYLNGVQTVEFTDNDPEKRALEGLLALQIHSGPPMVVEFRDVRVKQYGKSSSEGGSGGEGQKSAK